MNIQHRVWSLQDAKSKFSEVVRLAQTEGPQLVTVHGRPAVKIVVADEEQKRKPSIEDILAAFQACPHPEILEQGDRLREAAPLRNMTLDLG